MSKHKSPMFLAQIAKRGKVLFLRTLRKNESILLYHQDGYVESLGLTDKKSFLALDKYFRSCSYVVVYARDTMSDIMSMSTAYLNKLGGDYFYRKVLQWETLSLLNPQSAEWKYFSAYTPLDLSNLKQTLRKAVMIDIETLDIKTTAGVWEFGYVHNGRVKEGFLYPEFQPKSTTSKETLNFAKEKCPNWNKFSRSCEQLTTEEKIEQNDTVAQSLSCSLDGETIYTLGHFDMPILEHFIRHQGHKVPTYTWVDLRTLEVVSGKKFSRSGNHGALADAKAQMAYLNSIIPSSN